MDYLMYHGAGLGPLIEVALPRALPDARVLSADGSTTRFQTSTALADSRHLPFAGNVFQVVIDISRGKSLDASVNQIIQQVGRATIPRFGGGFRVMAHVDGALVGIEKHHRANLERALKRATGEFVSSAGGCQEFWVIGRSDSDRVLLGFRLPGSVKHKTPKGALAPDVSHLMVEASDPRPDDRFLDPFAGSGAIVRARASHRAGELLAADLDGRLVDGLDESLAEFDVQLAEIDARDTGLPDDSIDVIVTDPPWGEYERLDEPLPDFAAHVAAEFDRILDPVRGRLVLLAARRGAPEWVTALTGPFTEPRQVEILVNGHPATVLLCSRPTQKS